MLGASKRLLHFNNAGRRLCQRSISNCRISSYRIYTSNYAVNRGGRLDLPVFRKIECYFSALSGAKLKATNVEEATIAGSSESTDVDEKDEETSVGETVTRPTSNFTKFYRQREERFRNYSNSDYQNADALRKEFQKLTDNPDARITPVTAYQFIRNCGSKMSAEAAESRISLVMEIWEKLKEKGVELETTHYNALLSVYIQNRHSFSPLEFLADMQESKIQPDKSTYMLIVQAYCHEGDLTGALRVVDFMVKQGIPVSEPIYTALVTGHCRNNDMEGAHKILVTMRENNITPQVDTYTALIVGYAANGDMEGIDRVFAEMNDNGISTNALLYMNLLDSLCRHGHSSLLPEGLSRIKHKASVEIEMRYFLQRLITRGDYESAVILAKNNEAWLPSELLNEDDLSPHSLIQYRLVKANKSLDEMVRAARVMEAHGLTETPLEDILDICHGRRLTDDAIKMLDMLIENGRRVKPHYAYPMIVQLAEKEDLDGILKLLNYMSNNKITVDSTAFEFAAKAFKKVDAERKGELLEFAKEKGVRLSWRLSNENLDTILDGDSIDAFLDILPTIPIAIVGRREKSDRIAEFLIRTFDAKETPKAIIALDQKNLYRLGWVLSKVLEPFNTDDPMRAKDAFKIFNTLVKADAMKGLNTYCYTLLLNTFFKNSMKDEFFEVVEVMKGQGIEPNEAQYFIMLKMSSLIGNSAAAQFCFDKLRAAHDPTEVEYNALLISYGKDNGKGKASDEPNQQYTKKIVSLYEQMEELELRPIGLTVSQVIVAYISMGNLEEAEEVRKRYGMGVEHRRYAVYNEYLRFYSKQGNPEEAEKIFKEMKESKTENIISLFSYNQLIGAHKATGNLERVLELIDDLKEYGFTPNRVTISELTKCYIRRNEPEKALPILEEISENERLPAVNVLTSLLAEYFDRNEVENFERVVALIRRKESDEWAEQRLKHFLMMMYLKNDNYAAARDVVQKDDFRLTQRLIMATLGGMYKDIEFLLRVKNFLREQDLNYFLMDLSILNAYIALNDVDAAMNLFNEKKANDSAMTSYFLRKLANFLSSSGREVPFDIEAIAKKSNNTRKEELVDTAEKVEDKAPELNEETIDTVAAPELPKQDKE